MLQIVESLPEDKRKRFFKRSSVEDDILMFMNSGQRYCRITIRNVKGENVTSRCRTWLKRRNLTHIRARTLGGECYLVNEKACEDSHRRPQLLAIS